MEKTTNKISVLPLLVEMRARKLNQTQLASELDVSSQDITNWKARGVPLRKLVHICKWMGGISIEEYLSGSTRSQKRSNIKSNTEPGPEIRGKVPLISWTTAGQWEEVRDPYQLGDCEEWVLTTATVSVSAFALRVVGDSMEPKIPDGAIVIIDPAREYRNGSIVLAKRTIDQEATLKQLWYDGATPKLRPLNQRYQILDMPNDTRIIGVAIKIELDL